MVQFLLPELLELARTLGSPTHLPLPPTHGAHHHGSAGDLAAAAGGGGGAVSASASAQTLHKQLAKAVALTATTFGARPPSLPASARPTWGCGDDAEQMRRERSPHARPVRVPTTKRTVPEGSALQRRRRAHHVPCPLNWPVAACAGAGWTQAVLVPSFCAASACYPPALYSTSAAPPAQGADGKAAASGNGRAAAAPHHHHMGAPLQEAVEQLAPQTPAAAQIGRCGAGIFAPAVMLAWW